MVKKLILSAIVLIVGTFFLTEITEASIFPGKKKNGITTAWYSSSVIDRGYSAHFDAGRWYWEDINPKVWIGKNTGTYKEGQDKYFIGKHDDVRMLGNMTPYGYRLGIFTELWSFENWEYCVVTMYDANMRLRENYGASTVKYNAAHEIGHSLKLGHPPDDVTFGDPYKSVLFTGFRSLPSTTYNQDIYELNKKWNDM